jgi:hypothetical protein
MTDAVALWHATTRNAADLAAFNIAASLEAAAMSGFNFFCKYAIAAWRQAWVITVPYTFTVPSNTGGTVGISVYMAGNLTCKYRWGYKPTVLGAPAALTHVQEADPYTASISGVTVGENIYIEFLTETADKDVISGIYKVLALA